MKRLLALLLLCLCAPLFAQSLEIITLRHRPAEQLLPELIPLLEPGAALSGRGDKLFLRTSARNRDEILRVLAAIDQALRRLVVSVRQEGERLRQERQAEVSGDLSFGRNVRIIQPPTGAGGGTVEIRRGDSVIRGRAVGMHSGGGDQVSQQVQTVEGGRAWIQVGQAVPMTFRQRLMTPRGPVVTENLVYRDVVTGFYAEPRLMGERVEISISPSHDSPGALPGSTEIQRLSTTVSGRLGEWIAVGGIDQESADELSAAGRAGSRGSRELRQIWLKVDELP